MEARLSTLLVIQIQHDNCAVQAGAAALRRFTEHLLLNKTSAKNITSIILLLIPCCSFRRQILSARSATLSCPSLA